MSQEPDLERAVKEFQAGIDTERNSDLISRCLRPGLEKYFRKNHLLRNEDEDLTQDTLIRVFKTIGTFGFQCRFRTWVLKIAETVLIDALRRRKAKKRLGLTVSLDEDEREQNNSFSIANSLADEGATPEREMLDDEFFAMCDAAIENLSPRQREVLELHIYKELSNKEIATLLGISVETVRVTLRNARKEVKAYLNAKLLKR